MQNRTILNWFRFFLLAVSFGLFALNGCQQYSSGAAHNVYKVKFLIVNGLSKPGSDSLRFRVFHGISGNETFRGLMVPRTDDSRTPFEFKVKNFELISDLYLFTNNRNIEFASRSFLFPKENVLKIYWYPAEPPLEKSLFHDLKNKDKVPGKIVVYEMNETDSK